MSEPIDRYISLLTDFGFKRIFGTTLNKELLIHFLNALFDGEQVVKDVKYLNSEHVGDVMADRRAIFDVYCENEYGEKFIVEMQNAYQKHFKDRSLFYSTFPIREQAKKGGNWDFQLKHVYTVALLNYDLQEPSFDPADINHDIGLLDKKTHRIFSDKLTFKYVEVAKFNKSQNELTTVYDKWLYVLKNLSRLRERPQALQEQVFTRLFEEAEISRFTPKELREYENSLKAYRDIKNSIDTAREQGWEQGRKEGREQGRKEGREEGRKEGREEGWKEGIVKVARSMKEKGYTPSDIAVCTGLSLEEIAGL